MLKLTIMTAKIALIVFLLLPAVINASYYAEVEPEEGHPDECPLGDGLYLKAGEDLKNEQGCPYGFCFREGDSLYLVFSHPVYCDNWPYDEEELP